MLGSSISLAYVVMLLIVSSVGLVFGSILLMKGTIRGRYAACYLLAAAIFPSAMLITSSEGLLFQHLRFESSWFLTIVSWLLVLSAGYIVSITGALIVRYLYRYTTTFDRVKRYATRRFRHHEA
ncbi:hypothetical protein ADM98_07065 [Exiguobacterium sp. BMC-KP]|uniref:hypothetical protein n=1 Tax=Exiguobacterium sp. BMC-KP TaxID=1684312 RepID=UPI0006AA5917|nr:hypothetical protein [Exiguobacterium sp. BMC-KP]KOP28691.1 hypothetical protein ADM98_07065 [Exiguobacterium sp. BMC-KP]